MKAKINGVELEGTPQEFKVFLTTQKKETKRPVADKKAVPVRATKKFQKWSEREIEVLRKHYGYARSKGGHIKHRHMNALCRALPLRTRATIQAKAYGMGLTGSKESAMRRLLKKGGY